MVSCRTVQGRKRCAKRQAKPASDRAREGCLVPRITHHGFELVAVAPLEEQQQQQELPEEKSK